MNFCGYIVYLAHDYYMLVKMIIKRIVIFASGNGTNAQTIIEYFQNKEIARVTLVLSNKKDAKVLDRAKNLGVATASFTKEELQNSHKIHNILEKENPCLIILAGFLLKFPNSILKQFPNRVINIHPALLPKYGGKGMYGMRVHQAVVENCEKETGITIHYVNENYDEGAVIFQKSIAVFNNDTPETIAQKIHTLEHKHFPVVIENLLRSHIC